ncbi:MAG: NUDIX hydrolase [Candidatus Brocadiaceae bacterium]|nr:NUDIX hydrolase [Candidatus Brocadiaceae bacterium]
MNIYSGKKISVRKDEVLLHDGRTVMREVVDHPGSSAIIPFLTENEILLIRQYRHAVQESIYEVPAGTLEKNESFYVCAERELEEETGYRAGTMKLLIVLYPSPGILSETMHLFKATNLVKTHAKYETDESIEGLIKIKLSEALRMIRTGEIRDAKTVCSILMCSSWQD